MKYGLVKLPSRPCQHVFPVTALATRQMTHMAVVRLTHNLVLGKAALNTSCQMYPHVTNMAGVGVGKKEKD